MTGVQEEMGLMPGFPLDRVDASHCGNALVLWALTVLQLRELRAWKSQCALCVLQYIAVHIVPDQIMHFGGSTEPCALATLSSIGKIGAKQNKQYTPLLFDLVNKHLHISPKR